MHDNALNELLQQPGIWRGREKALQTGLDHVSTGFAELDLALPGNGWPLGALTEVLHDQPGIGELRLLMPALARLSRQGRWIALIAPPYIPYAPALAAHGVDLSRVLLVHPKTTTDKLWAVEQALRAGTCGAVLAWPASADDKTLRRLQLAAEAGQSWGILFRPSAEAAQPSPAALRLEVAARDGKTAVRLLKYRGAANRVELLLDLERRPAAQINAAPTPQPHARPLPRIVTAGRPRPVRPLRRPPPPSQLDLPLPVPPQLPDSHPLRKDKPGILTWLWRR